MRNVIKFFIQNTVAANLLMVFILIMGFFGLGQLKTTFFPETSLRNITVQVVYPGASPEEMEEGVVSKIEDKLVGVKGVKRTTSVSSENFANVNVETELGFDIDLVVQDVKNAVDQINSFPAAMEPPTIFKIDPVNSAYIFSVSGDMDLKSLKRYAEILEDDLLALDGISQVELSGFPEQEIEISFRESDLRALNITFDEAVGAIAGTNLLTTGGTIKTKTEDLIIRAKNKSYTGEAFENIVVRSSTDGGLIKLYQIADIKDQWEDSPERTFLNGSPSVVVTVFNTREEDMFENSDSAKSYLEEVKVRYPELVIKEVRDGKDYLNQRISFIKENGLVGFLLVLVLLALFLDVRVAFWVALAIPISFAGMFVLANFAGISINVITTFGMIVVIGILVDDGIVIAENIFQHYERGKPALEAAIDGTLEVLPAVSSAILTTVIAFSSFFFIDGRLGEIFANLAVVVIATLLFSLIEGVFILPAHVAHSKALQSKTKNKVSQFFDRIMNWMKTSMYGPVLKLAMNFPIPTMALCIASMTLIVGAMSGGLIKGTFFPIVQSDNFSVTLEMPAGTSETKIYEILDSLEKASWAVNEEFREEYFAGEEDVITKIQKNIGPSSYQGNLTYYLLDGEKRPQVKNRMLTNAIKKRFGPLYEADKLIFGLGGFFGDPVSISLLSPDSKQLEGAVKDLKEELGNIEDLTDIQDNNKLGLKEVDISLKPKAYNLGFTLGSIMRSIRQGFFGSEIQRLQRGSDEVKVWVRYKTEDRSSLDDLAKMQIRTPNGLSVPLGDLAEFSIARGVVAINHIDGQKEIRVTADVSQRDVSVSDVNADIQSIIIPKVLKNYPAVKVGFEGQVRQNAETMASMRKVMPLILLCMFFVVVVTFSSVSQAMIVFLMLPFGFIGVGLGHYLMGQPISFLSILGVIALIGILVNDALVFISTFNSKIKEGTKFRDALYDTGVSRFRPITLTTITTVAGLMPLLLEKSVQAQFLIPMAISVAFGLIVGTFILLVLIPALMVVASRIRKTSVKIWTGESIPAAMVEPSFEGRQHPWLITLLLALFTLAIIAILVMATFKISEFIV